MRVRSGAAVPVAVEFTGCEWAGVVGEIGDKRAGLGREGVRVRGGVQGRGDGRMPRCSCWDSIAVRAQLWSIAESAKARVRVARTHWRA